MMQDILVKQMHQFPLSINKTYNQILLFSVGITVSVCFAYFMLPFVYRLDDLLWYMFGMVVPLLPSILNMEGL